MMKALSLICLLSLPALAQDLPPLNLAVFGQVVPRNCGGPSAACRVAALTATTGTFSGGTIALTATTTTNLITSDTPDSVTSPTVGAMTFQHTQALTAGDLAFEFNNNAGNQVLGITPAGLITTSSATISTLLRATQINPVSTGVAMYFASEQTAAAASTTTGAFRFHSTSALDATDLHSVWHLSNGTTKAMELNYSGDLNNLGRTSNTVQPVTVADSGGGGAAASTLTPSSSYVSFTCSDADGCDITLSETGAIDGSTVRITNVSANACNFADTAGVTELAGAFAMGQYDSITLLYATDRWVEVSRSNN